jgi:hypothetical protein
MNYNLDVDLLSVELLPPDKRKSKMLALAQSLLSASQYAHGYIFGVYLTDLNERILFNGSKLVLEYALNTRYGTTFQQPPLVSDNTSLSYPQWLMDFSLVMMRRLARLSEPQMHRLGLDPYSPLSTLTIFRLISQ